jgi:hypothetical protein
MGAAPADLCVMDRWAGGHVPGLAARCRAPWLWGRTWQGRFLRRPGQRGMALACAPGARATRGIPEPLGAHAPDGLHCAARAYTHTTPPPVHRPQRLNRPPEKGSVPTKQKRRGALTEKDIGLACRCNKACSSGLPRDQPTDQEPITPEPAAVLPGKLLPVSPRCRVLPGRAGRGVSCQPAHGAHGVTGFSLCGRPLPGFSRVACQNWRAELPGLAGPCRGDLPRDAAGLAAVCRLLPALARWTCGGQEKGLGTHGKRNKRVCP